MIRDLHQEIINKESQNEEDAVEDDVVTEVTYEDENLFIYDDEDYSFID